MELFFTISFCIFLLYLLFFVLIKLILSIEFTFPGRTREVPFSYPKTQSKKGPRWSNAKPRKQKKKKKKEKEERETPHRTWSDIIFCGLLPASFTLVVVLLLITTAELEKVQGCDASLLLDPTDEINAEKDSPPHETFKGFDLFHIIKADELKEACPGIVSCVDALVLTPTEGVAMAGGSFYPLHTGRRDKYERPSPHEYQFKTIAYFASRGFSERETVSLLGANIGVVHCNVFENHPYNFEGTHGPDLSMVTDFLNLMRSRCRNNYNHSPSSSAPFFDGSPSSSVRESGMEMDYKGPGLDFGILYYRSLYAEQQLMAGEETRSEVRAYTSDVALFNLKNSQTMMKLSNLRVLIAPMGQVPINCSRVACEFCNHLVQLMLPYDQYLSPLQAAVRVVQKGLHPTIAKNTLPKLTDDLLEKCWQQDPEFC